MKKKGDSLKRLVITAVLCVLLAAFIISAGCKKPEPTYVYVCANGKEMPQKYMCNGAVKKTEAESYAKRYVNAYFLPYGGKSQLISSYLDVDAASYIATFVVADKGGEPYETEVSVDGVTGKVNCTKECAYIG